MGSCQVLLSIQELLFVSLREVMLLPDFGEQVRVGFLSGFIEQTRVMFVRLRENNTLTGFW